MLMLLRSFQVIRQSATKNNHDLRPGARLDLKAVFQAFDTDKSGDVDREEFGDKK